MSTTPHVIIVGAGTGGMCLAHGLRRAGISVAVYERERTRSDGLHGYRVGINGMGSKALHSCLPPDLFETFVATCARAPRYGVMLDERMRELLALPLRTFDDPTEAEQSVSRMTLRQVLLTGMDDVVHYDKTFTHYEQHADGTVTAHFADGTSAVGDLLVAADGARSRVRAQYLPDARVESTGIVAITMKAPVNDETRALLSERVFNGISMLFAPHGFFGILHVMEFKWDRDAQLKTGIGGSDADAIERWPGLLYDNTRDYVNLGVSAARDKFPADVLDLRGRDLVDLTKRLTPRWHPRLHRLMDLSDPGSTFPIDIQTSVPVAPWQPSTVTLLGDAVHTMTPGRGIGANTALRDAALLCRNLVEASQGRTSLLAAVADYETKMRAYGYAAVRASRDQMTSDAPLHKPVVGPVTLAAMRTMFRLTSRVAPMRRRMADNLYADREATDLELPNLPAGGVTPGYSTRW